MLVVEDDEEIAQVLQRSLRLEGYEVRLAADGEAALQAAGAFNPDLVVLDLGLPGLDGIDVARRLRGADDVPILMLTARDAGVPRRGPGRRRRRLPRQALRAPGAARAAARDPRRRPPAGLGLARRRRPGAEPRHPRGPPGRPRGRAASARVRVPRAPHAQRAHRRAPPAAAGGGLGLRPVRDDEHHRGLRLEPAAQARGRRRAAPAPHDPRRGVRPACSSACPSGGGSR